MTSLPTLPPYTHDSESDGEFLADDYELHKFLFPDSILNDTDYFGNIAALRNDDRLWCHDPRPPEDGSQSSDRLTLRPKEPETVPSSAVTATDDAHRHQSQTSKTTVHKLSGTRADNVSIRNIRECNTDSTPEMTATINTLQLTPALSDSDIIALQADDEELLQVIEWLQSGREPSYDDLRAAPLASRNLWSQKPAVQLRSGILVRCTDLNVSQLIVPSQLRRTLFDINHGGRLAAHLGAERTLQQLRQAYWWPGMKRDVTLWYKECAICTTSKTPPRRPHGNLQKIIAASPMDLVAIDILSGLPTASDGSLYILLATDYYTKWSECYALPDSEAKTCMDALYNNLFSRFGLSRQLHSDKGTQFESLLFKEMCKITGINKTCTTALHPRCDGQCERNNRTILQMLRCTAFDNPTDWPQKLPIVMAAYRMSPHKTTGVTPNYAMLGREVLLPSTLMAKPPDEPVTLAVPYARHIVRYAKPLMLLQKRRKHISTGWLKGPLSTWVSMFGFIGQNHDNVRIIASWIEFGLALTLSCPLRHVLSVALNMFTHINVRWSTLIVSLPADPP